MLLTLPWAILGSSGMASLVAAYTMRLRHRPPPPPEPVRYDCTCEHPISYHDPKTGRCKYEGLEDRYKSKGGKYQAKITCTCVRYVGPRPPEDYVEMFARSQNGESVR